MFVYAACVSVSVCCLWPIDIRRLTPSFRQEIHRLHTDVERLATDSCMQRNQMASLRLMAEDTALFTSPDGTLVSMRSSRSSSLTKEDRVGLFSPFNSRSSTLDSHGILATPLPDEPEPDETVTRTKSNPWLSSKSSRNSVNVWMQAEEGRQELLG
eukprot:TRINITY_DN11437_c0_g2_i3.p2 TRINITY_DN11437_c0_g2~~TRINITY_DN11437_c0_g2_i3.p2  ORF type:complete len:156 (+),score=23.80 TRINITY_DN11437_c0_g2_i3:1-468(+)